MLLKLDLVSEEAPDTAEALDKLEALLRLVSDELEAGSKVGVVVAEPLCQWLLINLIKVLATLVLEILWIFLLRRIEDLVDILSRDRIL